MNKQNTINLVSKLSGYVAPGRTSKKHCHTSFFFDSNLSKEKACQALKSKGFSCFMTNESLLVHHNG